MADGTQQPPVGAAPQPAPSPAPGPTPDNPGLAPQLPPEPDSDEARRADAIAEMGNEDAGSFLRNFLEDQGLPVEPTPPPAAAPPVGQQPPAAPAPVQPPGNAVPPAPSGGPPQPLPAVDPALLQRLFTQPPPAAVPPVQPTAATPWPTAPTAAPQPQPQPQAQPAELPLPFNAPFEIPANVAAALEADDPNVRRQAMGALISVGANEAYKATVAYVQQHVAPAIAQATFGQVQRENFRETVDRELYGNFPQLRYAAPALIHQATQVVVQDELSRNPNATVTPQIWAKIGQLASAGVAAMAQGQMPFAQPAPQPQQAAPGGWPAPAPQAPPSPYPGYAWNGTAYVPVAQPPGAPPWVAGTPAGHFGAPPSFQPTPESEMASFMQGGWA